jgi:carbon-monoxide dehydrogenase medium subunit
MKLRLSEPKVLIDIARIPGLSGIREKDGKIHIGAGTVHHDVATSALLRETCPVLADAAAEIGDPQVRNRGTLGGSLAHADPAADYPAVMLAVDAEIHLKGPNGWRVVKAQDCFKDLFTVDVAADEIIASVQFVPVRAAAYAKLRQRASHYAIVGVAAALQVNGGKIQSACVGLTGAGSHATRLTRVEQALAGRVAQAAIGSAAQRAGADLTQVNASTPAGVSSRDGAGLYAGRSGAMRRATAAGGQKSSPSHLGHAADEPLTGRAIAPRVTVAATSLIVAAPSRADDGVAVHKPRTALPSGVSEGDVRHLLKRYGAFVGAGDRRAPVSRARVRSRHQARTGRSRYDNHGRIHQQVPDGARRNETCRNRTVPSAAVRRTRREHVQVCASSPRFVSVRAGEIVDERQRGQPRVNGA